MKLSKKIIHRLMDVAIHINTSFDEACRDFKIMQSPLHPDTLLLRWLTIDISDVDRPVQKYYYECFELDGTPRNCSIYYSNQEEANAFFESLISLYEQQYAIDHKI